MNERWEDPDRAFDTTRWTLVGAACSDNADERDQALHRLLNLYWPAIYAWARRSGMTRDDAAEFTQAFFTEKVLAGELFANANRDRGTLRSLLLRSARNFRIDQHRRRQARGGDGVIPLDAFKHEELLMGGDPEETPERQFDRRWALAILDEALRRAEEHFVGMEKEAHWKAFQARMIHPAAKGVEPRPYADVAEELGFRTPADVGSAVQVVRDRVRLLLREVVGESLGQKQRIDEELEYVLSMLGG